VTAAPFYFSDTGGTLSEWLSFKFGRLTNDFVLTPAAHSLWFAYLVYFYSAWLAFKKRTGEYIFKFRGWHR
jgi:hypothetical protein